MATLTRGSLVLDTGSTGAKNDYFPLVHTPLGGEVVSTPQALDASFVPSGGSDIAGIVLLGEDEATRICGGINLTTPAS